MLRGLKVANTLANQLINQSKDSLDDLSSGTTARSTRRQSVDVQQVVRKRLPKQMCLEEATKIVANDSVDVKSSGRSFQVCGPVICNIKCYESQFSWSWVTLCVGVARVESLQQLLTSSDCITLHCRQTHRNSTPIVTQSTLRQMRTGKFIIH